MKKSNEVYYPKGYKNLNAIKSQELQEAGIIPLEIINEEGELVEQRFENLNLKGKVQKNNEDNSDNDSDKELMKIS